MYHLFTIAANTALNSRCKNKHGALITHGHKVLSKGYNHNRSQFHTITDCCLHAEIHAAMRFIMCRKSDKRLSRHRVIVVRVARDPSTDKIILTNSAPCSKCSKRLYIMGFRKIIFSNDDGQPTRVNLKKYHTRHESRGHKQLRESLTRSLAYEISLTRAPICLKRL